MNTPSAVALLCTVLFAGLSAGAARAEAPEAAAARAFELRMAGKAAQARDLLAGAIAKRPTDAAAHFELARTHLYLMKADPALRAIRRAVALDPKNARCRYWAGLIAVYSAVLKSKSPETRDQVPGIMKQWVEGLRKAVGLKPDFHQARLDLVNACAKAPPGSGGDPEEAERHAKALEAADPVWGAKARCMLLGRGARDKKLALWRKLVAQRPDSAAAHEELARLTFDTPEGQKHLEQALKLDPSRAELLVDLARRQAMAKRYDAAEQTLGRYLALEPPPPVPMRAYATFLIAAIHKRQGHRERAEKLLAEAKGIDPHVWTTFRQPHRDFFIGP